MIQVRKGAERGRTRIDWLDSRHTFSFGDYYDPAHMGFRSLRVMNDDRIAPGGGFGTHPHHDMEIVTYVLDGALEHRDSLGTGSVIGPGELQRMTAGTGIAHSEFNASETEPVHLYQIWLLPERRGLAPGYEQRAFPESERRGRWRLVASRDGRDGSLTVHQDVGLSLATLEAGQELSHRPGPGRHAWLQVLRGAVALNGHDLTAGDGAAVSDEEALAVRAAAPSEVILFDLA
jgi:redox-sensitive bicupin YhaK (pirin superfamily)